MPTPPLTPPYDSPRAPPRISTRTSISYPLSGIKSTQCVGHNQIETPHKAQRKRPYDETHIRRPANPFILFACNYRRIHASRGLNNRKLSVEAGSVWHGMSEEEKRFWREQAQQVKKKHEHEHPGYRYQPRRRESSGQQKTISEASKQDISSFAALPPTPITLPRKSAVGPKRTARRHTIPKQEDIVEVDSSILHSPTRQAGKSDALPRSFMPSSPVRKLCESPKPVSMN